MRFILIVLLCTLPATANAQYRVNERMKSHNVNQSNPHKLMPKIKKVIARYCKGVSAHSIACAVSKTDTTWKVVGKSNSDTCHIKDVKLTLHVTYHLPKWQNYSRQIQDIKVQWREIKKKIVKHEEQHGAISKKHMKNAYNEISRLKGPCDDLTDMANDVFNKHNKSARQEHRNFDARDGTSMSNFPD